LSDALARSRHLSYCCPSLPFSFFLPHRLFLFPNQLLFFFVGRAYFRCVEAGCRAKRYADYSDEDIRNGKAIVTYKNTHSHLPKRKVVQAKGEGQGKVEDRRGGAGAIEGL